ncbi:hypothetical protein MYX76_12760 [Desulfobacterota bacterium AH_259_B03_O07]|nr:hypothetical protein [Desulfobacterota bacterium AH_259_B03_O07]
MARKIKLNPSTQLFKGARMLRDLKAVSSFSVAKIVKRLINKWIGKNIVRRLWLR